MGKRREVINENRIEKYASEGYGSGEGKLYKPWIEIQDLPSRGRVSRININQKRFMPRGQVR